MIDAPTLHHVWIQHSDRLLLIARSIGEPAEDAVQEAFIALATQSQLPEDPLAWMVRVARNQILQWRRSQSRRAARESHSAVAWFQESGIAIDQRLDGCEVTAALQALPSPQREIIVMHLWGEMTFQSISQIVGVSRAATHREYQRGIADLRKKFNPDCFCDATKTRA